MLLPETLNAARSHCVKAERPLKEKITSSGKYAVMSTLENLISPSMDMLKHVLVVVSSQVNKSILYLIIFAVA